MPEPRINSGAAVQLSLTRRGRTMSIIRPDFFKVLPADLVRFGGDGAAFLALVRYAASIDGTDRITVDGVLWWRASHSDIGASLGGLSHDRVQRLASKLQAADKLLIYSPK